MPYPVPRSNRQSHKRRPIENDNNHGVSVFTLYQHVHHGDDQQREDAIRVQTIDTCKEMYADEPPEAILYCFGITQPLFEEMEKTIPNIVFHEGLPTMDTVREFSADRRHRLVVLDDLMHQTIERLVSDPKPIRTRIQVENHRPQHDVLGSDEKRERRLPDHNLGATTLSRTLEDTDAELRGRHIDPLRLLNRRPGAKFRRYLSIEDPSIPGRRYDGLRSTEIIRGTNTPQSSGMSRLLDTHHHFLHLLRTAKKDQRKALLKTIDKSQLKALCEIAHNIIKGTIVLTPSEKLRLKRFKKIINILGRKSSTRKERIQALHRGTAAVVRLLDVVERWRK
ncbi:unnamed protein product [Mytilus edulis]|uniref:Uncharacterized protein n=1 Tax=Mytilus edulis TaxID=6550 RepID=A0A8S3QJ55_MYTED|nr:unnamed protein product [Mytilus edulis]